MTAARLHSLSLLPFSCADIHSTPFSCNLCSFDDCSCLPSLNCEIPQGCLVIKVPSSLTTSPITDLPVLTEIRAAACRRSLC